MSPPVFLVDALPAGAETVLAGAEGHHAAAVRRLRPGEPVRLSDGAGGRPRFVVVQALAKGDRGELAVAQLTELGADEVVPWSASRSVVVWRAERGAKALARWRATAREAAKQSRRAWLPTVAEPHGTAEVAARIAAAGGGLVLDSDAVATLGSAPLPAVSDLVLVVGPEGGITEDELAACTAAGAHPVRLGPAVLRTSTAGAAALAVLSVRTGRWS